MSKKVAVGLPRLSVLTPEGFEVPDPRSLEKKTSLRMPSLTPDRLRQIVRQELARKAAEEGFETPEEADDFSLDNGEEWVSPYEEEFEGAFDHQAKPRQLDLPNQPRRVLPDAEPPASGAS